MNRSNTELILIAAIIALSAGGRYLASPGIQTYADEDAYARLGYSLSTGHLASDSSFLATYKEFGLNRSDIMTPFGYRDSVEPWLDHPPLMGFLLVPFFIIGLMPRVLPIILASGTALVVYLMLRRTDHLLAISALLYFLLFLQTFPILTMLFLDSAVSLFFVLTVATTIFHSRNHSKWALAFGGVTAGLAALSKVSGVGAIFYLVAYVLYQRFVRKENTFQNGLSLLIAIGITAAWPIYGFVSEPALFWKLILVNATRSTFSSNSYNQIVTALLSSSTFTKSDYSSFVSPILVVTWTSVLYAFISRRLSLPNLAITSYLCVLFLLRYAPPQMTIPLFPFYSISIAIVTVDLARWLSRAFRSGTRSTRQLDVDSSLNRTAHPSVV